MYFRLRHFSILFRTLPPKIVSSFKSLLTRALATPLVTRPFTHSPAVTPTALSFLGFMYPSFSHWALDWVKNDTVLRSHEVQHTQAIEIRLVWRGSNPTMDRALDESIGQEFERIRQVDNDASRMRLCIPPLPLWRAYLECSHRLSEEQR
jgi:hypothetical protein